MVFGPDGLLYIGTGDGGRPEDAPNAQDLGSLLGKLLRIDPAPSGGSPYGVPADNPFAAREDARGEVFAYGLRNPWRFSFDRETNDLLIGDVGASRFEEVDRLTPERAPGANLGWPAFEGNDRLDDGVAAPGHVRPVLTYPTGEGCSITGGYVVRDPGLPSLRGRYLYGDYCNGELRSFEPAPGGARGDRALGLTVPSLSSFGEDSGGRIYATSLDGPVFQLVP
jgi:glucose/arabinose dehydrogenase